MQKYIYIKAVAPQNYAETNNVKCAVKLINLDFAIQEGIGNIFNQLQQTDLFIVKTKLAVVVP